LLRFRVGGIEGEHEPHLALAGLGLRALRRARLVEVLPRVALTDPVHLVARLLAVPGLVVGALLHQASRLVEVGGGERVIEILIDALRARLVRRLRQVRSVLALRARLLVKLDGADELLLAEEEVARLQRRLGAHLAVFRRRARDLEEVDGGARAGEADDEERSDHDRARAPAAGLFVDFPGRRELLPRAAEAQLHVAELDHVARMERAHRVRLAVDADAVRASVVDDLPLVVAEEEAGMLPAERRMLDDDVVLARPSDADVGPLDGKLLALNGLRHPDEPRTLVLGKLAAGRARRRLCQVADPDDGGCAAGAVRGRLLRRARRGSRRLDRRLRRDGLGLAFDAEVVIADLDAIAFLHPARRVDAGAVDADAVVCVGNAAEAEPVGADEPGVAPRDVPLQQANGVPVLAADRDLIADDRDHPCSSSSSRF
jgi:hypothetical protein